ncbi:hypothetical protein M758_4G178300 [Ceratodon purpureus]|nr:hypothetical protein M758_4G178300 [Ceratodon purpureus]
MGWLWMCLGLRDKSARRIGGRVSSDTYLAPQYDPTKTPRIEDFLQPKRAGYDAFANGHSPGSPTSKSLGGTYVNANGEKDLAAGHKGTHLYRRCMSESIKGEYGPYWGYVEDSPVEDFVAIEFPRVTPGARKSFSELLIETDTLDKGPLALAAMAAAAERAARSLRLQREGSSSSSGVQIKGVNSTEGSQIVTLKAVRSNSSEASVKEQLEVQFGAGGRKLVTDDMKAHDSQPPQSPQSPHSLPLLDAATISSLSKDHLEASNAVAAFRESRRQSQMSEKSSTQQPAASNPSYISSLFRSSRKRSLPFRSRSFQRPLSPVPEVLTLEEELRNRRKSDVVLPSARSGSGDGETATSSGEVKAPSSIPPSKKQQRDSELAGGDFASGFPLTEEWDDYVLVERAQEIPTSGQRDEEGCENLDVDPATSSINGCMLDGDSDSSFSDSSEVALEDDATSRPQWDVTPSTVLQTPSNSAADCDSQQEDDTLLRTPVRDTLVTPEVFISPKTTTAELNFTRVMDMDPEERPIFGSLADHWEAAWATKRPTWDGKGIPNSTNKYREDQKVMWHAAPFEERLAQALATQQDSVPQRYKIFITSCAWVYLSSNS